MQESRDFKLIPWKDGLPIEDVRLLISYLVARFQERGPWAAPPPYDPDFDLDLLLVRRKDIQAAKVLAECNYAELSAKAAQALKVTGIVEWLRAQGNPNQIYNRALKKLVLSLYGLLRCLTEPTKAYDRDILETHLPELLETCGVEPPPGKSRRRATQDMVSWTYEGLRKFVARADGPVAAEREIAPALKVLPRLAAFSSSRSRRGSSSPTSQ
jgi:hypothetical protein